jgi:hypothetical protein
MQPAQSRGGWEETLQGPVAKSAGKGRAQAAQRGSAGMKRERHGWHTCSAGQLWQTAHWLAKAGSPGRDRRRRSRFENTVSIYSPDFCRHFFP